MFPFYYFNMGDHGDSQGRVESVINDEIYIYICVCLVTGLRRRTVQPNYEVAQLQGSVSDCSNPRLCRFLYDYTFI